MCSRYTPDNFWTNIFVVLTNISPFFSPEAQHHHTLPSRSISTTNAHQYRGMLPGQVDIGHKHKHGKDCPCNKCATRGISTGVLSGHKHKHEHKHGKDCPCIKCTTRGISTTGSKEFHGMFPGKLEISSPQKHMKGCECLNCKPGGNTHTHTHTHTHKVRVPQLQARGQTHLRTTPQQRCECGGHQSRGYFHGRGSCGGE